MLTALFVLTACGGGAPPPDDGPRDTLVIGAANDPKDLLSVVYQAAPDAWAIEPILVEAYATEFDCGVVFTPSFAKAWTWSADGKVLSVELRDDVRWSDGVAVTSADVAFTWELIADPAVQSPRRGFVDQLEADGRPKVLDATHIEWHFKELGDRATMMAHTTFPLVPKHLLDTADRASLRANPLNTGIPVVSGPWKVTTREKDARLVLEANELWPGPKPKLRRVVIRTLPDSRTRMAELRAGNVDLVDNISVVDADSLARENPEVVIHRRGWRSMDYVGWNSLDPADYKRVAASGQRPDLDQVKPHPLFADPEVRRALAAAVDVDGLIHDLLTSAATGEVYGRRSIGTITPALCGMHNDEIVPIAHDAAVAAARLGALGWRDSDGDGVLDKGGVPFRFTLLTAAGNERREQAAQLIQANLRAVGIDAQIEKLASSAFFDRLRKRDFDAALSGWSGGLAVDPTNAWGRDSVFNLTSYRNPRVAELIDKGMTTSGDARPTWLELQRVIYDDQPYTFLYWADELVAVHKRFQDTRIDILGPYRDLYQWSVPADAVKYAQ